MLCIQGIVRKRDLNSINVEPLKKILKDTDTNKVVLPEDDSKY